MNYLLLSAKAWSGSRLKTGQTLQEQKGRMHTKLHRAPKHLSFRNGGPPPQTHGVGLDGCPVAGLAPRHKNNYNVLNTDSSIPATRRQFGPRGAIQANPVGLRGLTGLHDRLNVRYLGATSYEFGLMVIPVERPRPDGYLGLLGASRP